MDAVEHVRPRPLLVGAGALAVAVLLVGLVVGKGGPEPVIAGLPNPGTVTGWGLPISKLALDVLSVLTVGSLLAGVVLAPGGRDGGLSDAGFRALHLAWRWALLTAVAAFAVLLFQASDILAEPVSDSLDSTLQVHLIKVTSQQRSPVVVIGLALAAAVFARFALKASTATAGLACAVLLLVPPALTGHSGSAANHDIATASLVAHVLAAGVWVGGLAGLIGHLRSAPEKALTLAARRYSAIALACFGVVAVSGVANGLTRIHDLGELVTTRYGSLLLGKLVLLLALGVLGAWHRARSLPALASGARSAFVRLAAVELLVMGAAAGLAVALSRSAPPVAQNRDLSTLTRTEALLGYDVPAVDLHHLLWAWRPDVLVLAVAVLALTAYGVGVVRLRRRGIPWPVVRTGAFVLGVLTIVIVTCGGMATYAMAVFSVHMFQHMVLTMLAPVLLACGMPITLALRALPAAGQDDPRGPREWLLAGLHSRPVQLLTQPVVALAIYTVSLYGLYLTPVFEQAMRHHATHELMNLHFVLVGLLFFVPVIGLDPVPRKTPVVGRLLLLAVSLPIHAFFGIILLQGTDVIAPTWYGDLAVPGVDLVDDQQTGGGIAWTAGELPTLLVLVAILPQWTRQDEREAARHDRRADADGDAELEAWNAHLARLAERDA
jgi:putative copper resistance protein D